MKKVPLSQGLFALVDDDFPETHKWHVMKRRNLNYAIRTDYSQKKRAKVCMHRFVLNAKPGQIIDHIDGNGLNNQRSNLRFCTNAENTMNSARRSDNTSGFKGVYFHKRDKKWCVRVKKLGHRIWIGYYDTPLDAAKAYNDAAIKHFGEFARINPL